MSGHDIIVIGASAGGVEVLVVVLQKWVDGRVRGCMPLSCASHVQV